MEGIAEASDYWGSQSPGSPDQPAPLSPVFSFPRTDARNPVLDDNLNSYLLEEELDVLAIDELADSYLNDDSQFQELSSFGYPGFDINPFYRSELDFEPLPDFYPAPPPSPAYNLPPYRLPPPPPPSSLTSLSPQSSQGSGGGILSPLPLVIGRDWWPGRQVSLPH
jgi:hypothetical protein